MSSNSRILPFLLIMLLCSFTTRDFGRKACFCCIRISSPDCAEIVRCNELYRAKPTRKFSVVAVLTFQFLRATKYIFFFSV